MKRLAFIVCVLFAVSAFAEDAVYQQTEDVVYGDTDGIGLLMDVFVPTGQKNGLGIVDIASGAWHSDRGKIRDHKMAKFYDLFCGDGYTVFAQIHGGRNGRQRQDGYPLGEGARR